MIKRKEYKKRIEKLVKKHGHMIQGVGAGEGEPEFCYTVGLYTTYEHPELVIVGLPYNVAAGLLNDMAQRIKEGEVFRVSNTYKDILLDYKVLILYVEPEIVYKNLSASRLYTGELVPALQVVWPDSEHRWPNSKNANEAFTKLQPLWGTFLLNEARVAFFKEIDNES